MRYVIEHEQPPKPSSCLPEGLNRSGLIDITEIQDAWRKYLDPATGKIHDGAKYFSEARRQEWQRNDIQETEFNG